MYFLFFRGTRKARIKTYYEHSQSCPECNDFDLVVNVYNDYYHFFFIPVAPIGAKTAVIHCNQCCKIVRKDSLAREYEKKTRNPFYLYTIVILLGLALVLGVFANIKGGNERQAILADPRSGDVFEVKTEAPLSYYFIRVGRVSGDSLIVLHSAMEYNHAVFELALQDHFVAGDSLVFMKDLVREMYNKGFVVFASRKHADGAGFSRIQ